MYIISQEKGNRNYQMRKNENVHLRLSTINTLKQWNERYNTVIFDSKFLKKIAVDVFGMNCLANSSVFGNKARNCGKQNVALDSDKLDFMRGKFYFQ